MKFLIDYIHVHVVADQLNWTSWKNKKGLEKSFEGFKRVHTLKVWWNIRLNMWTEIVRLFRKARLVFFLCEPKKFWLFRLQVNIELYSAEMSFIKTNEQITTFEGHQDIFVKKWTLVSKLKGYSVVDAKP